jgi:hypothetical protein
MGREYHTWYLPEERKLVLELDNRRVMNLILILIVVTFKVCIASLPISIQLFALVVRVCLDLFNDVQICLQLFDTVKISSELFRTLPVFFVFRTCCDQYHTIYCSTSLQC